jgi:catechol 2,3-dioxygenase-like lactoylglutathione lyase family enzyme
MVAKLKHIAIVTEQYLVLAKFYEVVFGMKSSFSERSRSAVTVGDGYVGLNINARKSGRQAGLDHFGFEVDDVESVFSRMRDKYPAVQALKRPGNRPFAGITMHDPAGNVFDLSQKGMENRGGLYEADEWRQPRRVHHLALRAVTPEALARFYVDLFDLTPLEKPAGDPNFYLSDGRITFIVMPWKITDYEGGGIERPALDHLGFQVESVDSVKKEVATLTVANPYLAPRPVGAGPEGKARLGLFSTCPYGKHHLADPDGVLIDASE